jgi:hypothetical protein
MMVMMMMMTGSFAFLVFRNIGYYIDSTIVDSERQLGDRVFSSSESFGEIRIAWYH